MTKLLLLAALAVAQAASAKQQADPPNFKKYYFVLLSAGPNQGGTPDEIERVQGAHRDNIDRLVKSGKMAIAGPFEDGGDLRGLFILDVPTKEEAEELVASDPAIKAGRLKGQVLAWWTERGRKLP